MKEKEMDQILVVIDKEKEKRFKELWTKEALEAYGENLQRLVKEGAILEATQSQKDYQPWKIIEN